MIAIRAEAPRFGTATRCGRTPASLAGLCAVSCLCDPGLRWLAYAGKATGGQEFLARAVLRRYRVPAGRFGLSFSLLANSDAARCPGGSRCYVRPQRAARLAYLARQWPAGAPTAPRGCAARPGAGATAGRPACDWRRWAFAQCTVWWGLGRARSVLSHDLDLPV